MGRDGSHFVFLFFSDSRSRVCFISCACFFFLPFVSFSYLLLSIPSLSFSLCLMTPLSLSLSPFFLIPGCIGQRGSKASCDIFDPWVHWQRGLSWDLSPSGVGVSSGGAGCGGVWNSGNLELWEFDFFGNLGMLNLRFRNSANREIWKPRRLGTWKSGDLRI